MKPENYERLPDGLTCKCLHLWREPDGSHWCCKGKPTLGPRVAEKPETCRACGRYTERGKRQVEHEARTKLPQEPLSKMIEHARYQIVAVRGQLTDIGYAYSGWRDRLKAVEGLLTCGLMALHHTMEEMREHERLYPKKPAEPTPTIDDVPCCGSENDYARAHRTHG